MHRSSKVANRTTTTTFLPGPTNTSTWTTTCSASKLAGFLCERVGTDYVSAGAGRHGTISHWRLLLSIRSITEGRAAGRSHITTTPGISLTRCTKPVWTTTRLCLLRASTFCPVRPPRAYPVCGWPAPGICLHPTCTGGIRACCM